ncbi:MAG TPA: endonuclease/exonuclease/phosphatase family protein [Tenuifilaceae bacterium]|nr:endonuclease/exonuclease/phosphatase family protein [Tenuifilaceae bacterium]HPQ34446.1 endonuclease/exonuclease/phosphatase family protein [Tenuifilaceae bacterium]
MKRFVIAFLFLLITFHFNANSQLINDLSFGTDNSLEVVTWNLELFPVNGQTTVENLSQALQQIEADVIAFQEIDNETLFSEMVNGVDGYEVAIGT